MAILLENSPWVILDSSSWMQGASILIEGERISAIGPSEDVSSVVASAQRIDCSETILCPGFVNSHNHIYQVLCRGLAKNETTEGWTRALTYPVAQRLSSDDYYYATLLGAADALRTGSTSLVSQPTHFARFHADTEIRGFRDAGIRARVARAASTSSTLDPSEDRLPEEEYLAVEEFLNRWKSDGLVQPWVGPSGFFSCDVGTLKRLKSLASAHETRFNMHLAETKVMFEYAHQHGFAGDVAWASECGLLDEQTVVAHCVWVTDPEIHILAESAANVVHNATSNMVMGSGVADVPAMLAAGVSLSLGTDGPASNDSQDMIAEMKTVALLHRVSKLSPRAIDAKTVFRLATQGGAEALGLGSQLGRLEVGWLADIVGFSLRNNPSLNPIYDPISSVVYCASGRDVRLAMVDGVIGYLDGQFMSLNVSEALAHIRGETVPRIKSILGL